MFRNFGEIKGSFEFFIFVNSKICCQCPHSLHDVFLSNTLLFLNSKNCIPFAKCLVVVSFMPYIFPLTLQTKMKFETKTLYAFKISTIRVLLILCFFVLCLNGDCSQRKTSTNSKLNSFKQKKLNDDNKINHPMEKKKRDLSEKKSFEEVHE
jgi:hypothetical protein